MFVCYFIIVLLAFVSGLYLYRTYINPTTIFTAGFLGSCVMCFVYYREWQMDQFLLTTFELLGFGVIAYCVACVLVKLCFSDNKRFVRPTKVREPNLSKLILAGYIAFQLLTLMAYCRFATQSTGEGNVIKAVGIMNFEYYEGDRDRYQPGVLLSNANFVMIMLNYYFLFVLAKAYAFKEQPTGRKLLIAICVIGTMSNVLSGSRGNLLNPILFFILVFYYLRYTCRFRQKKLTFGRVLIIALLCTGVPYLFFQSASIIGRDVSMFDPMEYIAAYLGGSIKNVDLFVGWHLPENPSPGSYTFHNTGLFPPPKDVGLVEFNTIGGYFLGNVYSCFAIYYYDYGVWGSAVLLFVMGAIMQYLYERTVRGVDYSNKVFDFTSFLFLYLALGVLFLFFGERFYSLLSWFTIKGLIIVYLFDKLVLKFSKPKFKVIRYGK